MTKKGVSSNSLRNLNQYKNLTDEEWEVVQEELQGGIEKKWEAFETRIQGKIKEFEEDYDLSDMKFNDTETLRALCQAMISLEDYEQFSFRLRDFENTEEKGNNLSTLNQINNISTKLRQDISSMQEDLKISRKIRQSDRELSVRDELATLKQKATKFYEEKMSYIYCDECSMLLSTAWFTFPYGKNTLKLTCGRVQADGTLCNNVVEFTTSDLMDMKGKNVEDVPDF